MIQSAKEFIQRYHYVERRIFVPRSCEYYLHYNVKLPLQEKKVTDSKM